MSSLQNQEYQNDLIFSALADATRRKLLQNLAENSPKTASQFAAEYPITRQGILKHLNILEDAGLVTIRQVGREKQYSLSTEPLDELNQWVEALSAKWDERLLRLKNLLESSELDE